MKNENYSDFTGTDLIRDIWSQLANQRDHSPRNSEINSNLTRLVSHIMRNDLPNETTCLRVLKDEGICEQIREFCQKCEYQMECFWAEKIISSATVS